MISSITDSSEMVDKSPNSVSFLAILANIRRIIFPDLVLGRALTGYMQSGVATGPIFTLTADIH